MKKYLIIPVLLTLLFITGCNEETTDYDQIMTDYAKQYYAVYLKDGQVENLNIPVIKVKDLRAASTQDVEHATYDIDQLSTCTVDSSATLTLDEDGNVTSVKTSMNCGN
jgi:hypothetical protein